MVVSARSRFKHLPILTCCIANVSYATPRSHVTPLLLAVRAGRKDIVQSLLEAGAKVSARDAQARSALFFASQSGDADLVSLLLNNKPMSNDSSLHEASRLLHVDIMKQLIEAGHDPNYRSANHNGRTALGEMAFKAVVPKDITIAEEALDVLCTGGASPLLKVHGKTIIFLALDNDHNEDMTRMLLERHLYRTLNSPENMYQERIYHYSPTMYVSKGLLLGPRSERLIQILRDHGAEDRYYATIEERQPHDAVGMPDEIREYERERRARERRNRDAEEEHAAFLRREAEKALNVDQIEDMHHGRGVRHRYEVSEQQRRLRRLEHDDVLVMKAEEHINDSDLKVDGAQVDSAIKWQRHNDELAMTTQKKINDANLESGVKWLRHNDDSVIKGQKRDADITHRQRTHVLETGIREDRHVQDTRFKDARHAQTITHRQVSHEQRMVERDDTNRRKLEFSSQKHTQQLAQQGEKQEQKLLFAGQNHAQRMTEQENNNRLRLEFSSQKHQQSLTHRDQNHEQKMVHNKTRLEFDNTKHAQRLRHLDDNHQQKMVHNKAQLEFDGQKHAQLHAHRDATNRQKIEYNTQRHQQQIAHKDENHRQKTGFDTARLEFSSQKHQQQMAQQEATNRKRLEYEAQQHKLRLGQKEETQQRKLTYDNQRKMQELGHMSSKNMLAMQHAHDQDRLAASKETRGYLGEQGRHHLKMTELQMQRDNAMLGLAGVAGQAMLQSGQGQQVMQGFRGLGLTGAGGGAAGGNGVSLGGRVLPAVGNGDGAAGSGVIQQGGRQVKLLR